MLPAIREIYQSFIIGKLKEKRSNIVGMEKQTPKNA